MNGMADEAWDGKAMNRISSIHFLDDGEDDDDDPVRSRNIDTETPQQIRNLKHVNIPVITFIK